MSWSTNNRIRLFRAYGVFISVIGAVPVFGSIIRLLNPDSKVESIRSLPAHSSFELDSIISFSPVLLIGLVCTFAPREWILKMLDWWNSISRTLELKDELSDPDRAPRATEDDRVLQRAGFALCVLGVLDFSYMVYCVISGKSQSLYFNFYTIAAGYFLYKGSLRVAVYVRLYCAFIVPVVAIADIVLPLMQPFDLTLTEMRLQPSAFFVPLFIYSLSVTILLWLVSQLGKDTILKTQQTNGIKSWGIRIPVILGCVLAIGGALWESYFLHGSYATKATQRALRRVPANSDYSAHVTSLETRETNNAVSVSAEVVLWNKQEIYTIPVSWHE